MLILIYDLSLAELTERLSVWGEPSYRAKQLWQGLYQNFWQNPDEFTTLPSDLREKLAGEFDFSPLKSTLYLDSSDGRTRKTLFELPDGRKIEAVLMKYGSPTGSPEENGGRVPSEALDQRHHVETKIRRTLCISTQVGCAMGCTFCATGQMGFGRHLSSGEIVAQVMYYARLLDEQDERVTNIVIMGMGEPFHNYDNTMAAIERLNDAQGYNFGARRITVSTSGLVPAIRRFGREQSQVNLAISLHATSNEARSEIMPVNRKYPIEEVISACREYTALTRRRVTFEWALIHGVNDTPEEARRLADLLKGMLCHVNAIPLNPTQGYHGQATSRVRAAKFREVLEQAGIPCTIRLRRGIDIQAGCGQLAVYGDSE